MYLAVQFFINMEKCNKCGIDGHEIESRWIDHLIKCSDSHNLMYYSFTFSFIKWVSFTVGSTFIGVYIGDTPYIDNASILSGSDVCAIMWNFTPTQNFSKSESPIENLESGLST